MSLIYYMSFGGYRGPPLGVILNMSHSDIVRITYLVVLLILSLFIFNKEMMPYQHDPVILLFLPIIIPLCCMKALFYMSPLIVGVEAILYYKNT